MLVFLTVCPPLIFLFGVLMYIAYISGFVDESPYAKISIVTVSASIVFCMLCMLTFGIALLTADVSFIMVGGDAEFGETVLQNASAWCRLHTADLGNYQEQIQSACTRLTD